MDARLVNPISTATKPGSAHVQRRPAVIAHRGASAVAPENTLLAFRLAAEAGAAIIETDAHLTRDGRIVLIHDADMTRTTSCSGNVADQRAEDLARCDTGYWFAAAGERDHPYRGLGLGVPTLTELFNVIDAVDPTVRVNIEIKNLPEELDYDPTDRLALRLVQQLHELGVVHRVIVSSFNPESIDRVKSTDPIVRTAYLCAPWADLHARTAYAVARGHDALHPHHTLLGRMPTATGTVEVIRQAGLELNVWTVNDPDRMRELAAAGVDGIMSDDPELLRKVLETM